MTTTDTEVTQEAPIDLDSLPPQIEALRAHAKERRGKGWLRSADNLEASAYLIETLAAELARHRTLTPAQAAGPVLLEATIDQVAELQLAAFLAGRGSVITKDRGSTMSARPAPTMNDFRRMARAAITQTEGPQV